MTSPARLRFDGWPILRARRGAAIAGLFCFVITSFYLFCTTHPSPDVFLYGRYAQAWSAQGLPSLYRDHDVEYPPLAVGVMRIAEILQPTAGSDVPGDRFAAAFRGVMLFVHGLAFLLFLVLHKQCFPDETSWELWERVLVFLVAGFFLRAALYNSLDLLICAAITTAFVLVMSRAHYAWSFAALAAGICLKVVPIILVPLWILASLPVALLAQPRNVRFLLRLGKICLGRLFLMATMVGALMLPFYLAAGPRCLAFLAYHRNRGVQFESTYAALLGGLRLLGYSVTMQPAYGSCDMQSPLASLFAKLAPWVVGCLLALAGGFCLVSLVRWVRLDAPAPETMDTIGFRYRQGVLSFALLSLLLFMVGNKVFSPQYLLWILTLAPLAPVKSGRLVYFGVFVALCAVTWLICPRYMAEVLGPTAFGTGLLVGRSLLMVGLSAGVVAVLVQRLRGSISASRPTILTLPDKSLPSNEGLLRRAG